ncbi:DUF2631 domain-containing protein [Antrihabitans cavernicola]|uniref:DUF2631 domain-containing protein n=1 Tax=Antrihabitans cavernicola TaxID=2495913 RepID=A0A5A7SEU8_9NOCA|nr:DUF2631 domain-containing protein [Spelaeibacter cavernicola]KAA0023237.1 DUF2631 domain-containing protein [Spelaeibacter cavernicola]
MAGTELNPADNDPIVSGHVDTAEVPSAAWGWSGESPKAAKIAGCAVIVFLLLMMIGNQKGHIEDIYLIGFAALIAIILVRDSVLKRRDR